MNKIIIPKQKSNAFGKDVYLLGTIDGRMQWLEAPSWDCGWYWGFGYVEEYSQHERPCRSRDIVSHTHIDSIAKNINKPLYDFHEAFDSVTFNDKEQWELAELFTQFYLLKEMAAFCHREIPNAHVSSSEVKHRNLKKWNEEINNKMIPAITARILEILSPAEVFNGK